MPAGQVSFRPPFKVYGFIRSGNHLLAATLQRAFFPEIEPRTVRNSGTGHWSQRKGPATYLVDGEDQGEEELAIPYGSILGTHVLPNQRRINPKASIYVIRDGRDVLLSCYNWAKLRRPDQEEMTFSEFIRAPIDWRGTPGIKVEPKKGYTIVHHWRDHVAAWIKSGVFLVRYEGVARIPKIAVSRVAKRFGLTPGKWRSVGPVGWEPSGEYGTRANVGTWRHHWSKRDLAFFDKVVGLEHPGRYDVEPETDYWNLRHAIYPDIRAVGHCGRSSRHNEEVYAEASLQLEGMIRADAPESVLDVGYGHGHHSKTCKRAGVPLYLGIDSASGKRLRMGKGYQFRAVDAAVPFDLKRQFDVVMLIDMAYHVVSDERFACLIANVKKHARKAVYVTGLFEDLPGGSEKSRHWYCRHRHLKAFDSLGTPGPLIPWRDNFIVRFEVEK